jgi:outer membrane protein assembly factor BamB
MRLLNIYIILFLLCIASVACNKKLSDDSPLPIVNTPRVLVAVNNQTMYALDATSGVKAWEFKSTFGDFSCTPIAIDTFVFVTCGQRLIKINGNNGKLLANYFYGAFQPGASPVMFENNLIFAVNAGSKDSIFRIDFTTGKILWRKYTKSNVLAALTINQNTLYAPELNGHIEHFDIGNFGISGSIADYAVGTGISLTTNITFDDKFMYVVNSSNQVIKVDPVTKTVKWKYTAPKNISSHPIVFGDMVFVGCENFSFYCIDANAGNTVARWVLPTAERVVGGACIDKASENAFIGSNDFNLYAINHVTGKLNWKFPAGSIINTSVVNYKGAVYFTSLDKFCYCVNAKTGQLNWKYNLNGLAFAPMINTYGKTNYYPAESGSSEY